MFRVRISLALLVLAGTSCAQSWCPPGAEWISKPPMGWPAEGYTRVYYAGDTVVGGQSAQRLAKQHAVQSWGSEYVYSYLQPAEMLTYEENGVVYLWSTQIEIWDTLFWFAAEPGDRWQRAHDVLIGGNPSDWIEVLDTSAIVVDGTSLRQLMVEQVCDGAWVNWSGTITERLGYWTPFYFPAACSTESGIWELRCYSDNEIDVTYGSPCDVFLSIATSVDPGSGPFPNPGTDYFTLTLPPGPHTVVLVDATGRVVLRQRANDQLATIDTTPLLPGIYGVHVDGGPATLRWVKE